MFEDYGARDRSLRAGDADRESVAEFLRDQHVAGRLDTDELQERLDLVFGFLVAGGRRHGRYGSI